MFDKELLIKKFSELLEASFGDSKQDTPVHVESDLEVVKSFDEYEKRAMFVVLEPQDDDLLTADLHKDWYGLKDVEEACHDYNARCEQIGVKHEEILTGNEVVVQESYIAPCDFVTESGEAVKKGSWVMWLHFPNDDLWSSLVEGEYDSVSIECSATGYDV
jgi:hypothetical protein